jgi:hypothetical protein
MVFDEQVVSGSCAHASASHVFALRRLAVGLQCDKRNVLMIKSCQLRKK